MSIMEQIYNVYKSLRRFGNFPTGAGNKLHETAIGSLGLDVAPLENEFGCAEAVNNIVYKAFGDYAGGDLSTYRMYHSIKNNHKFLEVFKPLPGDIILSPTGLGNGKLIGHTGIYSFGNRILSNNSETGKFTSHFTLEKWYERYSAKGGFPVLFYRRIWS